ncbi:MFS transporter [Nonomuraea sp. NPDC049152]|uniref:MFS transporter n=1 Tax=Nonomuraea sp. NPDC049152 TaxID=3154350 RepID=UPI0033EFCA51
MSIPPLITPTRRVGAGWISTYVVAGFGMQIALQSPSTFVMPQQIADIDPAGKVGGFAWVSIMSAVAGIVAAPLFGALSDRTGSRFGRRRPWIVGGALACAAAFIFLTVQTSVVGVAIGALLLSIAVSVLGAGYNTIVPDQVPVTQRGLVLGWAAVPQAAGLIAGGLLLALAAGPVAGYLILAAVLVLVIPFVAVAADQPLPPERRMPFSLKAFLAGYRIDPGRHPDYAWALATRFLMGFGYGIGTLYIPYFLQDVVNHPDDLLSVVAINGVSVVALSVFSGWLSDRIGRRRILVFVGSAIMATAAIMLALSPTWTMTIVTAVVLGVGYGIYIGVDGALITQVLPAADDQGRDLAIAGLMGSMPYVIVPAVASVIISNFGGYSGLYLVSAIISTLGAVLIWRIKSVP